MIEKIKQTEVLTDEEKQQLFGWGEDIFGVASLNLSWRPKEPHFVLTFDGKAISHVGLVRNELSVGGRFVLVAGIGGVVTVPQMQGKGVARKLIAHVVNFFKQEWKVDAGLLFCLERMVPYYASLGWQVVEESVLIEQPSGKIKAPFPMMVLPCNGKAWPNGIVELNSLPW